MRQEFQGSWLGRVLQGEEHRARVIGQAFVVARVMGAGGSWRREAQSETAAGRRASRRLPSGPHWTSSPLVYPTSLSVTATPEDPPSYPGHEVAPIPSLLEARTLRTRCGRMHWEDLSFLARGVRGQPQWTQGAGSWGPSDVCRGCRLWGPDLEVSSGGETPEPWGPALGSPF